MKPITFGAAIILTVLLGTGCSKPSQAAPGVGSTVSTPKSELDAKLAKMTPEERGAYVQAHPDEIKAAYTPTNP